MHSPYIEYYIRQKDWWRNMDKTVMDYHHMGEENHMYFVHMLTPKQRVDRMTAIRGYKWLG